MTDNPNVAGAEIYEPPEDPAVADAIKHLQFAGSHLRNAENIIGSRPAAMTEKVHALVVDLQDRTTKALKVMDDASLDHSAAPMYESAHVPNKPRRPSRLLLVVAILATLASLPFLFIAITGWAQVIDKTLEFVDAPYGLIMLSTVFGAGLAIFGLSVIVHRIYTRIRRVVDEK